MYLFQENVERSWTISSAHTQETNFIEITVKRKLNGKASTWMHDGKRKRETVSRKRREWKTDLDSILLLPELKVGDKFVLRGIDGDFSPFQRADARSPLPIVLQPRYAGQTIFLLGAGRHVTKMPNLELCFNSASVPFVFRICSPRCLSFSFFPLSSSLSSHSSLFCSLSLPALSSLPSLFSLSGLTLLLFIQALASPLSWASYALCALFDTQTKLSCTSLSKQQMTSSLRMTSRLLRVISPKQFNFGSVTQEERKKMALLSLLCLLWQKWKRSPMAESQRTH